MINNNEILSIAVTMLDELRPRLWKRIVLTLIFTGMAYSLFEGLTFGSTVMVGNLVMGIVGLIAVILIWVDYRFKRKIYHKYKNELIILTDKSLSNKQASTGQDRNTLGTVKI